MSFRPSIFLLCLAVPALSVEFGEKPATPQLPDSPYVVHDGTRPQPRIVTGTSAVSVKAPADATVLFDGSSLDAWKDARSGEAPKFKIVDGVMIANGADILSKESFGDAQIHLEWRLPAERKVNGQKGGNSGIFLQNLYELQILQSNNNKTYPDGQASALYGQTPPLVNATAPQGEWQSYDVIFKAPVQKDGKVIAPATITVLHNGVVTHAAKAFQGPTKHKNLTSYPENLPATGPLRLQWHSDPIEFRNIWVRPLGTYDEDK